MDIHVVKPGETLWKIARSSGRTVNQLAMCNNIVDPNLIQVGRVLRIPPRTDVARYTMDKKTTPYFEYGVIYPKGHRFAGKPHPGVDFHSRQNEYVFSIAPGIVRYVGYDVFGYGNYVLIEHRLVGDIKLYSLSAHLSAVVVKIGYVLSAGDVIGYEGCSGAGAGGIDHVHFELKWTDELDLFSKITPENLDNYYANPREVLENEELRFIQLWCWNCHNC